MHQVDHREKIARVLNEAPQYDTTISNASADIRGASADPITRRANYGRLAVLVGTPDYGLNDVETDIVDALANVLHYADSIGADLDDVIRVARGHVRHELEHGATA